MKIIKSRYKDVRDSRDVATEKEKKHFRIFTIDLKLDTSFRIKSNEFYSFRDNNIDVELSKEGIVEILI